MRAGVTVAMVSIVVFACSSAGCGGKAVVTMDAGSGTCNASAPVILASSYDRSCTTDSDCLAISAGNSCDPCAFSCPNAAINRVAYPKYMADTANLPATLAEEKGVCASSCGLEPGPCCVCGTCQEGSQCSYVEGPADSGTDASAAGCSCHTADACPAGYQVLKVEQDDGSFESFCSAI
jgi:hypothetical protein